MVVVCGHKLIRRDRPITHRVFFKLVANLSFSFCAVALSFLALGIGGVFVDFSGYNKKEKIGFRITMGMPNL